MTGKREEGNIVAKDQEGSSTSTITNSLNWSKFPQDLLYEIQSLLFSIDRIRFRAVCRDWRLPDSPSIYEGLPWVVDYTLCHTPFQQLNVKFTLFEPCHHIPYTVSELTIQDKDIPDVQIITSKNGWLFLALKSSINPVLKFILFSPFTKKIIKLQNLGVLPVNCCYMCCGTFSSDTLLTDSVFIVVMNYIQAQNKFTICMYRPVACGNGEWTSQTLIGVGSCGSVEFVKGALYCLTLEGNLIIHRLGYDLPNFTTIKPRHIHNVDIKVWPYANLIGYKEGILSVTYKYTSNREMSFQVFIHDYSKRCWEKVEWFPDSLFFYRSTPFIVPATGTRNHMANKIFYHDLDGNFKFYSFEDKKSHEYKDKIPFDGWIYKKERNATWFRPPCEKGFKELTGEENSLNSMDDQL